MAYINGCIALLACVVCLEPVMTTDCPDMWVPFKGSCYLFGHQMTSSFVEAEHYCRQHGAHLLHVDDATENAFLIAFLHRLKAERFWIGQTDEVVEGVWEWYDTHTKPTITDWYPGEPNNETGENCAEFYTLHDFRWNDAHCNNKEKPLCEMRLEQTNIIG